ncbi:MAG TPA: arsenate reductase family protein [Opitutaceae bacterium]
MLKIYTYSGCSTCRSAVKWLRANGAEFTELPIRETPPSGRELAAMLAANAGEVRRLFNTSGLDYRAQGLKDRLTTMSREEALVLLACNGNLIKRPFAIDATRGVHLVGFRSPQWAAALAKR